MRSDGSETADLGLSILGTSLAAGTLSDMLLLRAAVGLNVALWMGFLVLAAALISRLHGIPLSGEGRWLAIPALLIAASFAWHASPMLQLMSLLVLVLTVSLATATARAGLLREASVTDYVLGVVAGGASIVLGPLLLVIGDINWTRVSAGRWSRAAASVARGLIIAVPLLVMFGGLFVMADAVYAQLVMDTLASFRLGTVAGRLVYGMSMAWFAAGTLHTLFLGRVPDSLPVSRFSPSLGLVELITSLGSLKALFMSFLVVQFRYLFGGAAIVEASRGLTYASYARKGFFELVAVAALVLPVLLLGHWLVRPGERTHSLVFNGLAGALLVMLSAIMASAAYRMRLYQLEFGLTELRLHVMAFMGWLAVVFVLFALTVLRGHRRRFMFGAMMAGYVMLVGLTALNPDAFIVRANLAHYSRTGSFDAVHAASLGADAVPALVAAVPDLPQEEQRAIARLVLMRWGGLAGPDWRCWNRGRVRAMRAVERDRELLEGAAGWH